MTAIRITVTRAGRAALRNAQADGTNAVRITQCGLTDQVVDAQTELTSLPGEIKRLSSIAGAATSDVTMHVTVRDDGTDAYAVRGFAFYLADGTLFAYYCQAAVILEKTALSVMLLASDTVFAEVDATQLVFGDTSFVLPSATTERAGQVELATADETVAGLDDLRAVTPKGFLAALNARFGAGSPSAFVKGLLSLASASLFRTAIGVKSAAEFDTGAGKGLDADLLDGEEGKAFHDWNKLTGVPDLSRVGHTHVINDVTGLPAALLAKAPLVSPALSGTPTAPTPDVADNGQRLATTAFVQSLIGKVLNGAPGALDTLKELADAIGNDANFAGTMVAQLAGKSGVGHHHNIGDVDDLAAWLNDRPTNGTFNNAVNNLQGSINTKMASADMVLSVNGETGYAIFPPNASGLRLIYQFGAYRSTVPWQEGTGPSINFAMAFPNACTSLSLNDINTNVGNRGWNTFDVNVQEVSKNAAGFSTYLQWCGGNDSNAWCGMTYSAWGY